MCGICGIMSRNLSMQEIKLFRSLLFLSTLRGEDATGVISIDEPTDKEVKRNKPLRIRHVKETEEAPVFLNYNPSKEKEMLFSSGKRCLIGHTRSGTIGDSEKVENAHPFNFEKVIGVHNGTINKTFAHSSEYGTDSEALYRNINDKGLPDALQEVESYTSAYALAFVDKDDRSINFIRNDKRPLVFTTIYNGNTLVWASETWMLQIAIQRLFAGTQIQTWSPKPMMWYKYDLYSQREDWLKPEVREVKVKTVTSFTPASRSTSVSRTDRREWDWRKNDWSNTRYSPDEDLEPPFTPTRAINPVTGTPLLLEQHTKARTEFEAAVAEEDRKLAEGYAAAEKATKEYFSGVEYFHSFRGETLSRKAFELLLNDGCSFCGHQPDIKEKDIDYKIGWAERGRFICSGCLTQPWISEHMVEYLPKKDVG